MIIQQNELRVGNWFVNFLGEEFQINGTTIAEWNNPCDFSKPTPIPLTEDWLQRFGFKWSKALKLWMNGSFSTCQPGDYEDALYHHFAMFWCNDGLLIEVTNEHGENANLSMPKIKYVHQLQNLFFALTGTELTLTNK